MPAERHREHAGERGVHVDEVAVDGSEELAATGETNLGARLQCV